MTVEVIGRNFDIRDDEDGVRDAETRMRIWNGVEHEVSC